MKTTQYAIDSEGRLVYVGFKGITYTVWGIGENGLCHGAGAYLKRTKDQIVINEPTYQEMERHFDNLDKFNRFLNGE